MRVWASAVVTMAMMFLALPAMGADVLAELDRLNDGKHVENYMQSIDLCRQALEARPDDVELLWRCARAYRWTGELAKRRSAKGWEATCAENGKLGMQLAGRVIELAPDRVEGHLWYGYNVGIYSDGVSILTALKEGLKDKTQKSFEKAYEVDKNYEDAGAVLALGRFWFVLPWPLSNKKLSMQYLREYQQTPYFRQKPEGAIYLAELLIAKGGKENKAKAKELLERYVTTDEKYFLDWRDRLLKKVSG